MKRPGKLLLTTRQRTLGPSSAGVLRNRRVAVQGDDVLEFMRLIWSLDHALQKTSKRMRRELGVTGPQRLVIRIVGRHPGVTAGELARALVLDPSTLTGVLRRLEQRGLLMRSVDPRDHRRIRFTLTGAGRKRLHLTSGTVERGLRAAFRRLRAAQISTAALVLAELTRALDAARRDRRSQTMRSRSRGTARRR